MKLLYPVLCLTFGFLSFDRANAASGSCEIELAIYGTSISAVQSLVNQVLQTAKSDLGAPAKMDGTYSQIRRSSDPNSADFLEYAQLASNPDLIRFPTVDGPPGEVTFLYPRMRIKFTQVTAAAFRRGVVKLNSLAFGEANLSASAKAHLLIDQPTQASQCQAN